MGPAEVAGRKRLANSVAGVTGGTSHPSREDLYEPFSVMASLSGIEGASRMLSQNNSRAIVKSPRSTKVPMPMVNTLTTRRRITVNPQALERRDRAIDAHRAIERQPSN